MGKSGRSDFNRTSCRKYEGGCHVMSKIEGNSELLCLRATEGHEQTDGPRTRTEPGNMRRTAHSPRIFPFLFKYGHLRAVYYSVLCSYQYIFPLCSCTELLMETLTTLRSNNGSLDFEPDWFATQILASQNISKKIAIILIN